MPFKSEAQRRYLWAKEPQVARRWSHKYGSTPTRRRKSTKAKGRRRSGHSSY